MNNVKFKNWDCTVTKTKYKDGNVALVLTDNSDGLPITTASVNLPDVLMPEGYIAIKNYSENEGILSTLVEANIIDFPSDYIKRGYVEIPICKLKI